MRRTALLLLLASVAADGAARCREGVRRCAPSKAAGPLLQVLPGGPTSGQIAAGTLTGSKGETITVTRASTKTCTNTLGNLVTLTSGQPCVESAGLLVEAASTNLILKSHQIDNAAWTKAATPNPNPVVTANTTDVLDVYGTNTAEKVEFPASAGLNTYSLVGQTVTTTAGVHTFSVYLRTLSGSATTYVYFQAAGFLVGTPTTCTVTTTRSRCSVTATLAAVANFMVVGVARGVTGGHSVVMADLPAQTIYIEGAQLEKAAVASSYIATDGTATTRAADVISAGAYTLGSTPCMGVTATVRAVGSDVTLLQPYNSGTSAKWNLFVQSNSTVRCDNGIGGATSAGTITAGVSFRASCSYNGSVTTLCLNGVCNTNGNAPGATWTALNFGNYQTSATQVPMAWLHSLKFDNKAGTCL